MMLKFLLVQDRGGEISAIHPSAYIEPEKESYNARHAEDSRCFETVEVSGLEAEAIDMLCSCTDTLGDMLAELIAATYLLGLEHGKEGFQHPFTVEEIKA